MDRTDAAGCMFVVILVLAVVLVAGGGWLQTQVDHAAAERDRAEAAVIQARTDASAQRQENWEHSFMMWTVAMKAFEPDVLLFGAVLTVLGIAGYALIRPMIAR